MTKSNNTFQEIWDKLKDSKKILISLHAGPDGDSFGSCLAMKYLLEKQGKEIKLISHDGVSDSLAEMPMAKEIEFGKDIKSFDLKEYEILLCLDTGTPQMIGKFKQDYAIPKGIFVINIDHHHNNPYYGNLNYVDASQPSACSILINLIKELNIEFDSELSTRLLLGLCTDSGFFTFETAEKALKQASFLIARGGKYFERVVRPILLNQPLKLKKYYSLLVIKLKINEDKKFAWAVVTEEEIKKMKLNKADVRLGPNELQYIKEFDFIFTLADLGNEIKGSFRSKKGIDVSKFAQALGGGGHKAAAAFNLQNTSLQEAETRVLQTIEKVGIHKISE